MSGSGSTRTATTPGLRPAAPRAGLAARLVKGAARAAAAVALSAAVASQPLYAQAAAPPAPAGRDAPAGGAAEGNAAEVLFRFPVGGVVTSGPVVAAGRVWLLSDSRTLYTLTVDGVAIGKRALPERRAAFIVGDAYGRAAVSDGATGLSLINKAGQEAWRVELGSAPGSPPAFAPDGRLYVCAGGELSAFAPNGRRLWRTRLGAAPSSAIVVGPGGGPAIGLSDGRVALFHPDSGVAAELALGSAPVALAATADRLALGLEDGRVVVLSADEGSGAPTPAPGAPDYAAAPRLGSRPVALAAASDAVYALGADGALLAVDGVGAELWRLSGVAPGGPAALAAFDGRAIVLTRAAVTSYGPDGSVYRSLTLRNAVSMPAIAPNGAVFSGGADWILYAYRFERPLEAAPGPAIAPLDLEAIDAMAREEAFWTVAPWSDDEAMERLYDIEKSLESGTIGMESRRTALYLTAVALGRMDAPFGSGRAPNGPAPRGPLPRVYACGLLGRMGLPWAVPALVEAFMNDPEPSVRAAAAYAVATIGLDPEGRALGAFAEAAGGRLDGATAGAIVDAIDGLYRASGALDDRSGMLALLRIAGGDYARDIRSKAEKALSRVSRGR
ncbi:MAG TPA: PQQ-binding-like beta-propeller repeat protein [Spirochaetia bacterium]|nr:PQQ-binding-like beta-propeller repeat protein [Spirochaetia bacterium]